MVSGIGPAEALKRNNVSVVADRPGVGQNLWVGWRKIYATRVPD